MVCRCGDGAYGAGAAACGSYNNTAYYPSTHDLQSSLTLANSCSSQFTLKVMAYVSVLVPFVLAYIFYAWRSIDKKKIDAKEMREEGTCLLIVPGHREFVS